MKLEVGKYYTTRNGKQVRIYAMDGQGEYPVHGAVLFSEGWCFNTWTTDGNLRVGNLRVPFGGDSLDIVSEWVEKPIVDWDKMPRGCNWVAQDYCGQWYAYSNEPRRCPSAWFKTGEGNCIMLYPEHAPHFTGDWQDSLVQRP